jgi:hypothetical protein
MRADMRRILTFAVVIVFSGAAHAAAPEFNTDHFCGDFAQTHGGGNMGDIAKAVCLLSEESTKEVVDKAWDHISTDARTACLKAAGDSYISLAECLNTLPGQ